MRGALTILVQRMLKYSDNSEIECYLAQAIVKKYIIAQGTKKRNRKPFEIAGKWNYMLWTIVNITNSNYNYVRINRMCIRVQVIIILLIAE